MYYVLLFCHSWTRWAVLASALVALLFLGKGFFSNLPRSKVERVVQSAFVGFADLQFTLGLTLLFLSPLISLPDVHPWVYQHVGGMVLALTVLHGGNELAKKASTPRAIRRHLLLADILGLTLILASIPWPASSFSRPLFRALAL